MLKDGRSDLTIRGKIVRVDVAGDATRPAVMLSNSLGTDLLMWEGQTPALTKHFRVIRYDTRGHGGSFRPDCPSSIADLGADALAILDTLEIERTHWLGLSMGAAVGLWLLANAPARIGRAIIANGAPKLGTPETWNARIASVRAGNMKDNAKATLERWFSPRFAEAAPDQVEAIGKMLRSADPPGYASCCAALRDMDLREAVRVVRHEVLVISGRDDPVVPPEAIGELVASIDGAKHIVLDARHLSNIEAESSFNAAVSSFLTARPQGRTRAVHEKAASKGVPVVRGGAGRRSNPARNPLKKAPAKAASTRKASKKVRPAAPRADTSKGVPGRRSAAKTAAARRGPTKAVAKTPVARAKRPKPARARRPTPVASARSPIKKVKPRVTKAKVAAKKPVKKIAAKKLPAARRRAAKTPRRPTGRRKT